MTRRRLLPRYPVYIPTKGRVAFVTTRNSTVRNFLADDVPFRLVVERDETERYVDAYGEESVLTLPFSNRGSVIPARNWIKEHATAEGHLRHWQFDDNTKGFYRCYKGKRLPCRSGVALAVTEDFVDRYENIAVAGMNYDMFAVEVSKPFILNCRVYSATLLLNSISNRWRGRYNEDTDLCLQVLADGWCTILMNIFLVKKHRTMVLTGGNTDEIYQGDGRLRMARSLERLWPNVVKVERRWQRPQHIVTGGWRKFDTPLKRKPGLRVKSGTDEYGMTLKQVGPEVKSKRLKRLLAESKRPNT